MLTFVIATLLVVVIVAGMAIGVILGRKPIKGSCGGVGAALGEKDYVCDICGGDPNKCDETGSKSSKSLGYDAAGGLLTNQPDKQKMPR